MLNTQDIMKKLHKSRNYVCWLCRYGLIETRDYGKGYFATEAAVDEFIEWSNGKRLRNKEDIIREAHKKELAEKFPGNRVGA